MNKSLMLFLAIALIVCASAVISQKLPDDPFDGGFSISFDYGKLIATMGHRSDSLETAILDWMTSPDSIPQICTEGMPDGYLTGEDHDFATGDFNGDGMDEMVMAWSQSDGSIFVGVPTYDLASMTTTEWHTPDPPIAAGVLYATDTVSDIIGEIRVVAGNFYDDEASEFVLAYLSEDSTVSLTVYDVNTSSLVPEAKGTAVTHEIVTEMPERQRFGTASRFDIATGDLDGDGTDEIVVIAGDPAYGPESILIVSIYDYDPISHSLILVSENPHNANAFSPYVNCLRRIAATTGDFDADGLDEIAFVDDWAYSDEDTLHYSYMHVLDYSSDLLSIIDYWDEVTGDAHLVPRQSLSSTVDALIRYQGDPIACGSFWTEYGGGNTLNRIARWDGTAWRPLAEGMNNTVWTLMTFQDSLLIAGGEFSVAGYASAINIAQWNGNEWSALGPGLSGDVVFAVCEFNGEIIAGGDFSSSGGTSLSNIARWDGSEWHDMDSGVNGVVTCLKVYNGELYAGGTFTTAGGSSAAYIAKWDGYDWSPVGTGMDYWVHTLSIYKGNLIAGGYFTNAGGVAANRIARWNGSNWSAMGTGMNNYVYGTAVQDFGDSWGERLFAGGRFTTANGHAAYRLAFWTDDSSDWHPIEGENTGPNDYVRTILPGDNDLLIGGNFQNFATSGPVMYSRFVGRVIPGGTEGNGLFDTLHSRSDYIVDVLADDVDYDSDSSDELIVRSYLDPNPLTSRADHTLLIYNFTSSIYGQLCAQAFTECYRGIDNVYSGRRTMAVGDMTGYAAGVDDTMTEDIALLADSIQSTIVNLYEVHPDSIALGSASYEPLVLASRKDSNATVTDLLMTNLDTATIELGPPVYYSIDSVIQPLVILNVPPVHYDILNDTVYDISRRYPWPTPYSEETYCAYGNRQSFVTSIHSEISKDWGLSAGLKTNFSAAGATVKAHLDTEYGEGFSVQGSNTTTLKVVDITTSYNTDLILAARINYDVWEYPVYRRGERLIGGDVIVVDPSSVQKIWLDTRSTADWIPDHEVENIFSYQRYNDLADNPIISDNAVIEGDGWTMSPTAGHSWSLCKEQFDASTVEESRNFGIEVGASLGYEGGLDFFGYKMKWGIEVDVESNYDQSELNTYTTTFTTADSLHVQFGTIETAGDNESNRKYEVIPYAYWAKNGALVLDYAASPATNGGSPSDWTWWQINYGIPDPAFIQPGRYDSEKLGVVADDYRYRTKEIVFIPSNPLPGDTVLIIARVHNFSLVPISDPVQVSFYLGNPDFGGRILTDKNSGDSLFYVRDADGVIPQEVASQGEVAAQMVWQLPDAGQLTGCLQIWAYIDPLDAISPEVHDNDDEISNNKGWQQLTVNTSDICIDRDGDGYEESAYMCHTCPYEWDNCPGVYNPEQTDTDGDGIGDACENIICGDANRDLTINIGDGVYLINYIFKGGPAPQPQECAGDANNDTTINIGDAVYLITYIFRGGPAPGEACCE